MVEKRESVRNYCLIDIVGGKTKPVVKKGENLDDLLRIINDQYACGCNRIMIINFEHVADIDRTAVLELISIHSSLPSLVLYFYGIQKNVKDHLEKTPFFLYHRSFATYKKAQQALVTFLEGDVT